MTFRYEVLLFKIIRMVILHDPKNNRKHIYSLQDFKWKVPMVSDSYESSSLPVLEAESLEEAKKKIEYIFLEYCL